MTDFPSIILHADDDADILEFSKQAFATYKDVKYKTCFNGKELILSTKTCKPDLVLLDLKMPGANGPDVIEAFKKEGIDIPPIIIITGYTGIRMDNYYKKMGVIGVLHKPLRFGTFPERIRFIWNEYQQSIDATN